jgi:hypothetical protein
MEEEARVDVARFLAVGAGQPQLASAPGNFGSSGLAQVPFRHALCREAVVALLACGDFLPLPSAMVDLIGQRLWALRDHPQWDTLVKLEEVATHGAALLEEEPVIRFIPLAWKAFALWLPDDCWYCVICHQGLSDLCINCLCVGMEENGARRTRLRRSAAVLGALALLVAWRHRGMVPWHSLVRAD